MVANGSPPMSPADGPIGRFARLELGSPSGAQLAIAAYSLVLRVLGAIGSWLAGVSWLVSVNGLGVLLYLVLIVLRRRHDVRGPFIAAYGLEWLLWSIAHRLTFGFQCSFQLYPLLLLPTFVLLFHDLAAKTRLLLLVLPLVLYGPFLYFIRRTEPLAELSVETQFWTSLGNELTVAATVVAVASAALLEHVRARRGAEQREATQAQLVEDLSHELQTPLATLLTLAQGVRSGSPSSERVAERLGWIEESAREASRLVERLLDLAELDHGRRQPGPRAPLSDVARGAAERARALAEQRGIAVDFLEEASCLEQVDAASLEIVLRNLLANAIAHSPPGSRVEVRVRSAGGRLRIDVEDRGEGMTLEQSARVFDRLWRADPARSRGEGRLGLGLSIARRHAELLGAEIEVRSKLGEGSVFSLVFSSDA